MELTNLGGRLADLIREVKALDADRFPNAATALLRVTLELAVGRVHDIKTWGEPRTLRDGVEKCLHVVDPTDKARRWQPVRAGLADGTSFLSIKVLQGQLHNEHFHPSGAECRRLAATYGPFLQELDRLV